MAVLDPAWFLEQETRSLLSRLDRVKPFVLQETMVPAASLLPDAQVGIERALSNGRRKLRRSAATYLTWLRSAEGAASAPEEQQRRYAILRLQFTAHLAELEVFSGVVTQRSESELGVWLSGLDVAAADGLSTPGGEFFRSPPIICYVDRGHGASIRRVQTRLPAGSSNPVAIIKIPRERMIGHGIASSLMHEVGHQGAALLQLVPSLKAELTERAKRAATATERQAWTCWSAWISEIVADLWSVAKVGIGSTLGLVGVVGLPKRFVFRVNLSDPHPFPWIRVRVSAAIGRALYPHPQWDEIDALWQQLYPRTATTPAVQRLIANLERTLDDLADTLVEHRPAALRGHSLGDALRSDQRRPERLLELFGAWEGNPRTMQRLPPALSLAVLGQARATGRITPEQETAWVGRLLAHWAMRTTIDVAAHSATTVRRSIPIERRARATA